MQYDIPILHAMLNHTIAVDSLLLKLLVFFCFSLSGRYVDLHTTKEPILTLGLEEIENFSHENGHFVGLATHLHDALSSA